MVANFEVVQSKGTMRPSGLVIPPSVVPINGSRHIAKALVLSESGDVVEEYPSKQLTDPFETYSGYGTAVKEPPYSLDQLAALAEMHPTHAAALEQKTADIIASGFRMGYRREYTGIVAADEDTEVDKAKEVEDWWHGLFSRFTSIETLTSMWLDYETIGQGYLEVARDLEGNVRQLYHVPSHTMRSADDGTRFVQIRDGQVVWFKLYGIDPSYQIMASTGRKAPSNAKPDNMANEVIEFRKPSRSSFWYSPPTYVSSLGFILLAVAARDYNLKFFQNFREPRHVIFVSGLNEDVDTVVTELRSTWEKALRDNPHSNIILPIVGEADVQVEEMTKEMSEAYFADLIELADTEILVSHRMPPDRLGAVKRGLLGGDASLELNQIYKQAVVDRGQAILESRLQQFVDAEFPGEALTSYRVDFEDLDVADMEVDTDQATNLAGDNLITINEARMQIGRRPLDKFRSEEGEDLTILEYEIVAEERFTPKDEGGGNSRRFSASKERRDVVKRENRGKRKGRPSLEELIQSD